MNVSQAEDFMIDFNLEEGPAWEAQEKQEMNKQAREDLDTLQDFIKNGFYEPKFVF